MTDMDPVTDRELELLRKIELLVCAARGDELPSLFVRRSEYDALKTRLARIETLIRSTWLPQTRSAAANAPTEAERSAVMQMKARVYDEMVAALTKADGPASACEHEWHDARNSVVTEGEWCPLCCGIREGNEAAPYPPLSDRAKAAMRARGLTPKGDSE